MEKTSMNCATDQQISGVLYFVTTNRNLLSILAGGAIYIATEEYRYYPDSRSNYDGRIVLWKEGIPIRLRTPQQGDTPSAAIVLEIRPEVLDYLGGMAGSYGSNAYSTENPIPLSYVSRYIFPEQSILDDFLLRLFDEVPLDQTLLMTGVDIPWEIETPLFKATAPENAIMQPAMVEPSSGNVALPDRCAGAMLALYKLVPSSKIAITLTEAFYATSIALASGRAISQSMPHLITGAPITPANTAEKWLLDTFISILGTICPEIAFDPFDLVEQIRKRSDTPEMEQAHVIPAWCDHVKRILENDIECHELADEKSIIQRAILLFILRPEIRRLESAMDSSLKPGPAVYSWAVFFAGYYTGAVRMGAAYKHSYEVYTSLIARVLQDRSLALSGKKWTSPAVKETAEKETASAEITVTVNNHYVCTRRIQAEHTLQRMFHLAKSFGIQLSYSVLHDELYYLWEFDNKDRQIIKITMNGKNLNGEEVVRFKSPCGSFRSRRGLKIETLLGILSLNFRKGIHCSLAYDSENGELFLLSHQIVKTMDEAEFFSHLMEVATAAYQYRSGTLVFAPVNTKVRGDTAAGDNW